MLIACPRCETTFSLPDALYKPGKKARCSQCALVFPMPGPDEGGEEKTREPEQPRPASQSTAAAPGGQRRGISGLRPVLLGLAVFVLLTLLGYGSYLIYGAFTGSPGPGTAGNGPGAGLSPDARAELESRIKSIGLDEIRQFQVDNARIGKVMVIQGVAVNNSSANKDYITIEARLLDINNKVLMTVRQLCGVQPTLFQLQTLSEPELMQTLNNRTSILINNTNIPPQGRVSFVMLFPRPPENTRTFELQVIDVHESPPE
ncbi:zinc-ribbon domain-containing protein [Desulfovibrio sp. OttesenSCG-928-A18]|nr:zinc-ribbon domain-containing protein [Desulfovibrio sp. OttesenSCG-928-A18]